MAFVAAVCQPPPGSGGVTDFLRTIALARTFPHPSIRDPLILNVRAPFPPPLLISFCPFPCLLSTISYSLFCHLPFSYCSSPILPPPFSRIIPLTAPHSFPRLKPPFHRLQPSITPRPTPFPTTTASATIFTPLVLSHSPTSQSPQPFLLFHPSMLFIDAIALCLYSAPSSAPVPPIISLGPARSRRCGEHRAAISTGPARIIEVEQAADQLRGRVETAGSVVVGLRNCSVGGDALSPEGESTPQGNA